MRFTVVGKISYRCALPGMTIGSADDAALNKNAFGKPGTFYRIRIASPKSFAGREVLDEATHITLPSR